MPVLESLLPLVGGADGGIGDGATEFDLGYDCGPTFPSYPSEGGGGGG